MFLDRKKEMMDKNRHAVTEQTKYLQPLRPQIETEDKNILLPLIMVSGRLAPSNSHHAKITLVQNSPIFFSISPQSFETRLPNQDSKPK